MAPSNALSSRRSFLRRPIICKPPPPPPPPPPPEEYDVECEIGPETPTVEFEGSVAIELFAYHSGYPEGTPVATTPSATDGEFTTPHPIANGVVEHGEFEAPGEPGIHTLKCVFEWPDTTICIAFCEVEEEEEPD